jgi:integrase
MARKNNAVPSYLLHKPTGQARVRINGKDHYLGAYGSEESRVRYGEVISKLAGGQPIDPLKPASSETGLSVSELVLAFLRHAEQHYVKNGKQTSEVHCLKSAVRPLVDIYGFTAVDEFGPLMLKAVRQRYVESGWVRYTCNKGVSRIRSVFRWGVENELVRPETLQKLQAVAPLLAGRTEAKDNPKKTPVSDAQIVAVKPHVSALIKDLIDVQRFTGARAGELLMMTPEKIDRSGSVWLYFVDGHKTEHHGHSRVITIGKRAQRILRRRLKGLPPSQRVFRIRRDSYTLAIRRACLTAEITPWTPHQLRHAFAHEVRERFGLEHVQATLGHAEFSMSERYAQASLQKAIEVAAAGY